MSEHDEFAPTSIDFTQIEQVAEVFFKESKEILSGLDQLILNLEARPEDSGILNHLFRQIHTLKGSVGAVPGGQLLGSLAHEFEALLSQLKKEQVPANKECIDLFLHSSKLLRLLAEALSTKSEILPEVLSEVIDLIHHYGQVDVQTGSANAPPRSTAATPSPRPKQAEEGVWFTQNQINEMLKTSGDILVLKNHFQNMMQAEAFQTQGSEFSQELAKVSEQLQNQLARVLKVSAEECFKGLPALVRQAMTELNKEVVLESSGLEVMIDKNLGRDINEAVMHLVRNSLDHGIEDPFDRATSGKPSTGRIQFHIFEENGWVKVSLKDDGRGLNRQRILEKAHEKNLVSAEDVGLSDAQIFAFIFHPGFSTKEKITTISGRGVGMDVVNEVVQKYRGRIHIHTAPGEGTEFLLEFAPPQHLTMETTILCEWQELRLAVPFTHVMQIKSVSEMQVNDVGDVRYCQWNAQTIPLLDYREICQGKKNEVLNKTSSAVIIRFKDFYFGLLVDSICGQVDLIVKPFSQLVKNIPGLRGTAVIADEQVTYMIEPETMVQLLRAA